MPTLRNSTWVERKIDMSSCFTCFLREQHANMSEVTGSNLDKTKKIYVQYSMALVGMHRPKVCWNYLNWDLRLMNFQEGTIGGREMARP